MAREIQAFDWQPPSQEAVYFPATRRLLGRLKKDSIQFLDLIGLMTIRAGEVFSELKAGRFQVSQIITQLAFTGVDTLGIVLILNLFCGMVIALQLAQQMVNQGAESYVGALVSIAMLRELSPIMTAVGVIAMGASAYAAELATMKITRQVDALRVLHVNPIRYLMLPRVLGAMAALPLLTILTATAGVLGGLVTSSLLADLPAHTYLDSVWQQIDMKDIICALVKASVFGFLLALISTTVGLEARGGSKEVGTAATRSVVWSFVAVAITDYILTYLFYGNE